MPKKGYKMSERERFVTNLQNSVRRRGEVRILEELDIVGNTAALNAVLNVLRYVFSLVLPVEPVDQANMLKSKRIRDEIRLQITRRLYLLPAAVANYVSRVPEAGVEDVLYQLLAGRLQEFLDMHRRGELLQPRPSPPHALPPRVLTESPTADKYRPYRSFQTDRSRGTELEGSLQPVTSRRISLPTLLQNSPFGKFQATPQSQAPIGKTPYGWNIVETLERAGGAPFPYSKVKGTRRRQKSSSPETVSKRAKTDQKDETPLPAPTIATIGAPTTATDLNIDPALKDYVSSLASNEQQPQEQLQGQPQEQLQEQPRQQPQKTHQQNQEEGEEFETSTEEQEYLKQLNDAQRRQEVPAEQPEAPANTQVTRELTAEVAAQEQKLGMTFQDIALLQQATTANDTEMEEEPVHTWDDVQQTQGQIQEHADPMNEQICDPMNDTIAEPMDEQMGEAAYEEEFNSLMNVDEMEE
ncbi:hypothetical protein PENANT_c010G02110 [Penicillium antarcticum]|uniref:Uncharacterized protein n=1 Tax=Penicillium antarcticum TaxID=416450 RepID=A0A1V6Q7V1_9EURO|nr:uncharacterized protein N7508_000560 [Penicillium antarcticum]KAJ5320277.1 hypothetical protein N7508_000560 [Penicillium antarcticum]OQD85313.1 hypothetical protein PENANT_c010G02110 [Penicillium antarcticum]